MRGVRRLTVYDMIDAKMRGLLKRVECAACWGSWEPLAIAPV